MIANQKIEFYPLWIQDNYELFKKYRNKFLADAKKNGLENIKEYWQCGLFYIEASK